MTILENLSEAVQEGSAKEVTALVDEGLRTGLSAQQLLEEGLLIGMSLLGEKFTNNEVFMPEVLIAAHALNAGTELLKTRLKDEGVEPVGKIVLGTVKGDLHDIGKNIVRMMLEGAGFHVIDLGVDVSEGDFVAAVKEHNPDIVALSSLLTTSMAHQGSVINALIAANARNQVKVIIGGAPVTQAFCEKIGADGYSADAASAAKMAKTMIVEGK